MLEYVGERTEWVCYRILTSLYMLVALVIVYMRYFHIELYSASECYMYRMTGYYCPGCGGTLGGAGVSACGTVAKPEVSSGCFTWRGNVDRVLDWHDM